MLSPNEDIREIIKRSDEYIEGDLSLLRIQDHINLMDYILSVPYKTSKLPRRPPLSASNREELIAKLVTLKILYPHL